MISIGSPEGRIVFHIHQGSWDMTHKTSLKPPSTRESVWHAINLRDELVQRLFTG
jgi:hypothetical protein